jgi:hypothetical protein
MKRSGAWIEKTKKTMAFYVIFENQMEFSGKGRF